MPYISETDSPPNQDQDQLSMRANNSGSLRDPVTREITPSSPGVLVTTDGQPTRKSSPTVDESVSKVKEEIGVLKRISSEGTASIPVLKPKKVIFNNQVYYSEDAITTNSEISDKIASVTSSDSSSSHETDVYRRSSQKTTDDSSSNHNTGVYRRSSHKTTENDLHVLSNTLVNETLQRKKNIILVLFSGTDSVGEVLRERYPNCDIINVDSDAKCPNLTHNVDVLSWKYWNQFKPGDVYAVWASPPCTGFSRTNTLNTTPAQQIAHAKKLELGCKIAKKTLEIINYLNPEEFFIENPYGGLREQKFMQDFKAFLTTTSYCMFGKPFRKNTDIWSKHRVLLPECSKRQGTMCEYKRLYNQHPQRATQGTIFGHPGTPLDELNRIPEGLVRTLFRQTERTRDAEFQAVQHKCEPKQVEFLNLLQTRIEQLEVFDECEHPSLVAPVAPPLAEEPPQSLFKAAGTSKPRLLTFRLALTQNLNTRLNVIAMLDSGSSYTIISQQIVEKYGLEVQDSDSPVSVALADGRVKVMTKCCKASLNFNGRILDFNFLVLDIPGFDIILGMDFLDDVNPDINWPLRSLRFRDSKVTVWAQPKHFRRPTTDPQVEASVASITAEDFSFAPVKMAAHLLPLEAYNEHPEWQGFHAPDGWQYYQTLDSVEPGFIAVIMPCNDSMDPEPDDMAYVVSKEWYREHPEWSSFDTHTLPDPESLLLIVPRENELFARLNTLKSPVKTKDDELNEDEEKHDIPTTKGITFAEFMAKLAPRSDDKCSMTEEQCNRLKSILNGVKVIFDEPTGLPEKRDVVHKIVEQPHTVPPCFNSYRMSPTELQELKTQLDFLLSHGYIRPSSSPYGAPVLFAPKKDGKLRLCLDFRGLNNQTIKDKYPLPRDQDIFDQLHGAKYFTSLDALWGYWQIRIADEDVHKTSVRTPLGSYEFLVMPFGLTNAPATFQRFMESVLRPHLLKYCMVYIDDIIIYSKTAEEHLKHIEAVLKTLAKERVCIKLEKCQFFQVMLHFLGHIVSGNGIAPDPKKIKALNDWPVPKSLKELQSFVGLGNYYRRHVQMFADAIAPLTSITDKEPFESQWNAECDAAFMKAKEYLTSAEVLALPDPTLPYIVRTDASNFAIGGSLHQVQGGEERVLAYESRKLSTTARNWPTHERELYAYFHCFHAWRHYLHGAEAIVQGDHKPLLHIKTQKDITAKQARWLSFLDTFDMKLEYLPGKMNIGPDGLSRRPDYLSVIMDLSDDKYFGHDIQEYVMMLSLLQESHSAPLTGVEPLTMKEPTAVHETASERYDATPLLGDPSISVTNALIELLKDATKHDATYKLVQSRQLVPHRLEQYDIVDGILFYRIDPKDKSSARIYVPQDIRLQYNIIFEYHDTPFQGHFGRDKTVERIRRHFYWPDLEDTVNLYIKSCDRCQRFKYRTHKVPSTTEVFPVPDYPWQMMSLDEKSGLPLTNRGNDSVWVFVDKLSKRAHLVPTKHKINSRQMAMIFLGRSVQTPRYSRGDHFRS
jgi:hypothetical protein